MVSVSEVQFKRAVGQTKLGVKSIGAARAILVDGLSLKLTALKYDLTREKVRAYAAKIQWVIKRWGC